MKKLITTFFMAAVISVLAAASAFAAAGVWLEDENGYWWQRTEGGYPANEWRWIDGNGDGVAECYHFNTQGYMDANTWVDGYYVDKDGAWCENGSRQTKLGEYDEWLDLYYGKDIYSPELPQINSEIYGTYRMATELVDSSISIVKESNGETYLYFKVQGVHEDGSSADQNLTFTLQNVGGDYYVADEVTYSGDMLTFHFPEGDTYLQDVRLNGESYSIYWRTAY